MNPVIKLPRELLLAIYQEAKVQSLLHKRETGCSEAQREDIQHELYQKGVEAAMWRYNPESECSVEHFAFVTMKYERMAFKRRYRRDVHRCCSIESLGTVEIDGEETPRIELVPGDEGKGAGFDYETEEMEALYRRVLASLSPRERLICVALRKAHGNRRAALRTLQAQGMVIGMTMFYQKIVPALYRKVKGILKVER